MGRGMCRVRSGMVGGHECVILSTIIVRTLKGFGHCSVRVSNSEGESHSVERML